MFSQFNHLFAQALFKVSFIRWLLLFLPRILYPEILLRAINHMSTGDKVSRRSITIWLYVSTIFICLLVQGTFAYIDGRFWPSSENEHVINFLDDKYNILNYFLLVPGYIIAGFFYLLNLSKINEELSTSSSEVKHTFLDDQRKVETPPWSKGWIGVFAILFLSLLIISDYAIGTLTLSDLQFWFHDAIEQTKVFNSHRGYYYVLVNYVLNIVFLTVAMCHFGIFWKTSFIIKSLSRFKNSNNKSVREFLESDTQLQKAFQPYTNMMLCSRIYFAFLVTNIFVWNLSGVSGQSSEDVAIDPQAWGIALILVGGWIVAFPRFYIEYYIEQLRNNGSAVNLLRADQKRYFTALNIIFVSLFLKFFVVKIPWISNLIEGVI